MSSWSGSSLPGFPISSSSLSRVSPSFSLSNSLDAKFDR